MQNRISRRAAMRRVVVGALAGEALVAAAATPDFTIVAPGNKAVLTSPVLLRMSVVDAEIGLPRDGRYHLHFSVDGGEEVAVYHVRDYSLKLSPGMHVIAVEIAGPSHRALGPPKRVAFMVRE